MGNKKKAPGQGPTNEQFLAGVFGETNSNILYTAFKGHPHDAPRSAWVNKTWAPGVEWDPAANNYTLVSTFNGTRSKRNFAALHCIMLDDIIVRAGQEHVGGKIPMANLPDLPVSWAIETSPNNAQVGFILAEPVTELYVASRLIAGVIKFIVDDGGSDPGMAGVTRYFKLPVGTNGKHGWENRTLKWEPARRYTLRELCAAFHIDHEALLAAPKPVLYDTERYPGGGDAALALEWYGDEFGGIKSEENGIYQITCPWVEDHTEQLDNGCAIGSPGSDPDLPGFWFNCFHDSCKNTRHLKEFMLWARENGFQRSDAAADFADLEEVDLEYEPPKEAPVDLPAGGFQVFGYDEIDNSGEPPRQLVEDVLVYGEMTLITAQPNTGKSAFALDMAIHVADGAPWHGKLVEQSTALYICAESPQTIKSRMLAVKAHRGGQLPLYGTYDPICLTTEADRRMFTAKIKAWLKEYPDTNLIIVDTFRAATPGVSESDQESAGPVIVYLHGIAKATGRHLVLIHHTTKAGNSYSGTGQFGATVDTEIVIWDETDIEGETLGHDNRGCLVAHTLQQRGLASKHEEFFYQIESAETGRINNFGKRETAPVVRHLTQFELDEGAAQAQAEERARALEELNADMDAYAAAARQHNTLSAMVLKDILGWTEPRAKRARGGLVDDGAIRRSGNNYVWL